MSLKQRQRDRIDFANAEIRVDDDTRRAAPDSAASGAARCGSGARAPISRRRRASCSCDATHASSSRALNGLTRYSSAPALQDLRCALLHPPAPTAESPESSGCARRRESRPAGRSRRAPASSRRRGRDPERLIRIRSRAAWPSPTDLDAIVLAENAARDSRACRRCRRRPAHASGARRWCRERAALRRLPSPGLPETHRPSRAASEALLPRTASRRRSSMSAAGDAAMRSAADAPCPCERSP